MGICLGGKLQTGIVRCTSTGFQLCEHGAIIGRITDNCHILPVLGRTAYHGRAPDIDILDGVRHCNSFLRDCLTERIQIDAYKINRAYSLLFKGPHVLRKLTSGEYSAMNLGMKSLHPAVQNLRESCDIAYSNGLYSIVI